MRRIKQLSTFVFGCFCFTRYGSVMDYFEIFMQRMILCRKAADRLGMKFKLVINGQGLI